MKLGLTTSFSAAHHLSNYNGPCANVHGHTWKVDVVIESDNLNEHYMVMDFKELKRIISEVMSPLDHNDLNIVIPDSPTAEKIVIYIGDRLYKMLLLYPNIRILTIRVWESENAYAEL